MLSNRYPLLVPRLWWISAVFPSFKAIFVPRQRGLSCVLLLVSYHYPPLVPRLWWISAVFPLFRAILSPWQRGLGCAYSCYLTILLLSSAGAPALVNLWSVSFIRSHIKPMAVGIRLCPTAVILPSYCYLRLVPQLWWISEVFPSFWAASYWQWSSHWGPDKVPVAQFWR